MNVDFGGKLCLTVMSIYVYIYLSTYLSIYIASTSKPVQHGFFRRTSFINETTCFQINEISD